MPRLARLDSLYAVAALVMAAAALFEAGYGGPEAEFTPLSVCSALLTGLAVLLARWTPLGAIVLLAAVVAVPMLFVPELPPSGGAQLIVWMLLVGNAAYRLSRDRGLVAYGVAAVVPAVTIVVAGESVWEFLFYGLILAPAWVVGVLLRREQRRSAELAALAQELRHEREKQAEVAVAAERTRISRELHDAVAHTVSVMTLQVGRRTPPSRGRLGGGGDLARSRDARSAGGRRAAPDRRSRPCGRVGRAGPAALAGPARRAGDPGSRHRHLGRRGGDRAGGRGPAGGGHVGVPDRAGGADQRLATRARSASSRCAWAWALGEVEVERRERPCPASRW